MSAEDEGGGRPERRFSGRRAQLAREAAGRSRRWVASEIGRTYYAVVNYELGRSVPRDRLISRYAAALGVDVEDLFAQPGDARTLPEPDRLGRARLADSNAGHVVGSVGDG